LLNVLGTIAERGAGFRSLNDDYEPDFIIRLKGEPAYTLIIETKGYDPLKDDVP
jgi:hypothetical protein